MAETRLLLESFGVEVVLHLLSDFVDLWFSYLSSYPSSSFFALMMNIPECIRNV